MDFYLELRKLNRQRNLKTKELKKKLKFFLLKLFYRKKSTFIKNDYKKYIFMHSQAIGDAIVTSGIIKALRDNDFKVYVMVACYRLIVLPGNEAQTVAHHVHDAQLDAGFRVDRVDGIREPFQGLC